VHAKGVPDSDRMLILLDATESTPDGLVRLSGVELALDEKGNPPTSFQIFANGTTATTKGPIMCDAACVAMCLSAMSDMGRDSLPIDYGHAMVSGFSPSYDSERAAGWFKFEERNGAMWAVDVKWTPKALQALKDREFRYFSPAIYRDRESGKVLRMVNMALTNLPATLNQTPLVTAEKPEVLNMDPRLVALLAALSAANIDQAGAAVQLLKADLAKVTAERDQLLTAAAETAKQLEAANAAVAKFNEDAAKASKASEHATLIATLSSAGKLPPALHAWAKETDTATLRKFGEMAPVIAAVDPAVKPVEGAKEQPSASAASLSDEEREVADQLGISLSDFAAQKALLASAENKQIFIPRPAAAATK
jgi:phage I-like protein